MADHRRELIGRAAAPLVWLAYVIVPAGEWGWFHGRPLDLMSTAAIASLGLVWLERRRLGFGVVVAIALALKVAVGVPLLLPRGLDARYYATHDFSGPIERGTEPAAPRSTRVDRRLRFGADGAPDLPLHFFNDYTRFNFYRPGEPNRNLLPVSVEWRGLLRVRDGGAERLYVRTGGAAVSLYVGDRTAITVPPTQTLWSGDVPVAAGLERLVITASFAQGVARRFEAGRVIEGREQPFDATDVFRRSASRTALAADLAVRGLSLGIDAVLSVWLLAAVLASLSRTYYRLRAGTRVQDALVAAWTIAVVDAIVFAVPAIGRLVILTGGDDWLTYETLARDVGLNGLWMTVGERLGHGHPFYYQPFYPYFVAACHWIWGDSLFGVFFLQRLLVGATVVALWRTTAMLFDERAGAAGLIVSVALAYEKFAPWAGVLLSDVLFVPTVAALAYLLVRLARDDEPSRGFAAWTGALGGIATLTRSTLVLGWPVAVPAVWIARRRRARRSSTVVALVVALVAVTSLATLRNWVVARELVPIASSGSVNLFLGNAPQHDVVVPAEHERVYKRLGLDFYAQTVVEFARQSPGEFLRGWGRKARYTLGWFGAVVPGAAPSWFYLATCATALIGVLLVPSAGSPMPVSARLIPLLLALSCFAAVVIFHPQIYGDRLILPFYALITPYAAVAVASAWRRVSAFGSSVGPAVLWAAVFAACIVEAFTASRLIDPAIGVATASAAALSIRRWPDLGWRRAWAFVPLVAAAGAWLWTMPTRPVETTVRLLWLFAAATLTTGRLLGSGETDADLEQPPAATGWLWQPVAYGVGFALALAALQPLNHGAPFAWTLVNDARAALGVFGAGALILAWAWCVWPWRAAGSARAIVALRLAQGAALAVFVAAQAGVRVDANGGALLLAAALLCGVVVAWRARSAVPSPQMAMEATGA